MNDFWRTALASGVGYLLARYAWFCVTYVWDFIKFARKRGLKRTT